MLKKFFSNVLSSFMGAWIALMLFGAVATVVVLGIIGSLSDDDGEKLTSGSVLCLNLDSEIAETNPLLSFDYASLMNGGNAKVQVLRDLVTGLEEGAANKDIKMLYISCKGVSAAPATLHALRDAVLKFKKSGKKIVAYGNSYSQADYYIASAADEIYLNPMGTVGLAGLSGTTMFFKNLLDKLGVKMQIFKVGTYKSAVEPYVNTEMSEPARAQFDTLYGAIWNVMSKEMAEARKIKPAQLDTLIDRVIMMRNAHYAKNVNLVDSLVTGREMDNILADMVDRDVDDINYVTPQLLAARSDIFKSQGGKNQIAVIYACGEIAEGSKDGIDCETLVPVITDLADNDDVKAVVLRVNSPGGSVFGSAEIADALSYLQSNKKPLVVSMGDYAASGGYWISCEANKIYADPLTITGSIGVFGMIPDISGLLEKIGVTMSTVSTNPSAPYPSILQSFTPSQNEAMQQNIENIYTMFVERVAKGRKLKAERVRQIAEGRVWSAVTAKQIGLVDNLGSLEDAVECAAKLAGIEGQHTVGYYPEDAGSFVNKLMAMQAAQCMHLSRILGPQVSPQTVTQIYTILGRRPEQALIPVIQFNY